MFAFCINVRTCFSIVHDKRNGYISLYISPLGCLCLNYRSNVIGFLAIASFINIFSVFSNKFNTLHMCKRSVITPSTQNLLSNSFGVSFVILSIKLPYILKDLQNNVMRYEHDKCWSKKVLSNPNVFPPEEYLDVSPHRPTARMVGPYLTVKLLTCLGLSCNSIKN